MLDGYVAETTFKSLFERLQKDPAHLLLFFETAASDETWCDRHPEEVKEMISWLNSQMRHRSLPHSFAVRAASALRAHYQVLEPYVPLDITLVLSDGEVSVNSLVLCANSSYFRERVERECRDRDTSKMRLSGVDQGRFNPFYSYIRTGEISGLATSSESELIELLHLGQDWKFEAVIAETQRNMLKYVSKERALPFLLQALKERWPLVALSAIEILNVNQDGYSLYLAEDTSLGFSIKFVTEACKAMLASLADWIASLTCGKGTVDDLNVASMAKNLKFLKHLDLSGTGALPLYLDRLPTDIQSITLRECPWLTREAAQKIATAYPQIEELSLEGNSHLDSAFWSILIQFKGVKRLNIAGCYQMDDADFTIAIKSCQLLEVLHADSCTGVGDKGFGELARRGRRLVTLSLSNCRITDRGIAELSVGCPILAFLDLSYCRDITEKGVLVVVKNAKQLHVLDIDHVLISQIYFDKIRMANTLLGPFS